MQLSITALALVSTFMQASAAPGIAPQPASVSTCGYPTVPLLRAWNHTSTFHFYTTNTTEMDAFLANGYTAQGIAAYILPSDTQAPTAVPLFRLYRPKTTDHYYTASASDRDRVVANDGYVTEGVAGYVYADEECGTVPLYRLFGQGGNFFTADEAEVHDYVEQWGYRNLGITAVCEPAIGAAVGSFIASFVEDHLV